MEKRYSTVAEAVKDVFGEGVSLAGTSHVGGGDINEARRLSLSDGNAVFLKSNRGKDAGFFAAEAAGLSAIAATGAIAVPKVLALGTDGQFGAFLMLENVESRPRNPDYWTVFAEELATMHRADTSGFVSGGRFGFYSDNFIGASPQGNSPRDRWIDFFRECRLAPFFERAGRYFDAGLRKKAGYLLDHLDEWLVEPEQPSLLHGDLWGGNAITGSDGKAWLIDPAVYVGHAEADLAMTELFGGFAGEFYRAYEAAGLLSYGYEDRKDLYNLYHLLNHLILFGGSYYGSVERIVRRFAG